MNAPKRKVSLMVDADLADALDDDPDGRLAAKLNATLRAETARAADAQPAESEWSEHLDQPPFENLSDMLAYFDERDGPLTEEEEAEVDRLVQLFESMGK
jgi:hypothetical protein